MSQRRTMGARWAVRINGCQGRYELLLLALVVQNSDLGAFWRPELLAQGRIANLDHQTHHRVTGHQIAAGDDTPMSNRIKAAATASIPRW